jgi:hypothetical protein
VEVRIAILTIRREPFYRRDAFEKMLQRHGYIIPHGWPNFAPNSKADLLVLWNKKRGHDESEADRWERQGGTVLVVENGYLQKIDKTYYAISVHGHNGSGWFPIGGENRFSKLGFELKPWHERVGGNTGTHILVCGQRGIGSSLMASPQGWAEKHCTRLEAANLKFKFRPHPGNFAPKVPLEQDLAKAHACHIWSSGAGVRALVEGVEVKHHAPHWICDRPANRVNQLHRMAHGQWHHEEIASGEPLARILSQIDQASW